MGPRKLASEVQVDIKTAEEFINNYSDEYRGVSNFSQQCISTARQNGYSTTLFGRKRFLPELSSNHRMYRENAERMAVNTPGSGNSCRFNEVSNH